MKTSSMIICFLLCVVGGAVLYLWGLKRQTHKTEDLMNLLFSNGVAKVKKHMRSHESVTKKEVEALVDGMQARFPFSTQKAVVTETDEFTKNLLAYMVRTGQLNKEGNRYTKA